MRLLCIFALALLASLAAAETAGVATYGHCHTHHCRNCHCKCEKCPDVCEGRPPMVGYYPTVTAIGLAGTKLYPIGPIVKSYPDISCPSGFEFATADSLIEISRNIVDAVFMQKVAAGLPAAYKCKTYLYPDGQVVGTIHSGLSATTLPKHYSITGCFKANMKRGIVYDGYGQGILNYKCKEDSRGTIKQIAIIKGHGSFKAQ